MPVTLLDTTLRDGEQSPNCYFSLTEKLEIAEMLSQQGFPIIEVGIPAMGHTEVSMLKAVMALNLRCEVQAWLRLTEYDLIQAIESGVQCVHFSVPISDTMLKYKLGLSYEDVCTRTKRLIKRAQTHGLRVSVGAEDASRTNIYTVCRFASFVEQLGAVRFRYADTLGLLSPEETAAALELLCRSISIPVDFHAHNDFGLALANACAAWKSGAAIISGTILGIGERAGNTALEQFMAVLALKYGEKIPVRLQDIKQLCRKVAEAAGRQIPADQPIIGSQVFSHESGIHVDGLLKHAATYEAYAPLLFGAERELVIGKHSGRAAVRFVAEELGARLTDREIDRFLIHLRRKMDLVKNLRPDELLQRYIKERSLE